MPVLVLDTQSAFVSVRILPLLLKLVAINVSYLLCFDLFYQVFPKKPDIPATRDGFHKSHKTRVHVSICFLFSSHPTECKTKTSKLAMRCLCKEPQKMPSLSNISCYKRVYLRDSIHVTHVNHIKTKV